MSEIDKIKEEIGWLKLVFGILIAIDVSIIGWAVQNFNDTSILILSISAVIIVLVSLAIIIVNRRAYKIIDKLGDI